MKKMLLCLIAAVSMMSASCEALMQPFGRQGILQIRFADGTLPSTRAAFPDTNDFLLTVSDSKGKIIYEGTYGASQESFTLDEGTYTVNARSCEFSAPLFDSPQWGDTQVASVKAGKTTVVTLACVQLNSGIRLRIASTFITAYPGATLFLKSAAGKLMYGYKETRIAYFQPGTVNLEMNDGGVETTLFSRRLEPQQVLTLGVNVDGKSSRNGIVVQVDTTRNWTKEDITVGGGGDNAGFDMEKAYSVSEAKSHAGEEDVWVYGYIVGGDLSSSKCSFSPPFSSRTNLVLATKSSCKDKSLCMSVQLAKGNVRDNLNLVDHPSLVGRQIFIKGTIVEAYYGIPGVQNISEYQLKE
ncbi:MAG: DUF4493 domain-containing protein [Bacteroidales bacterium]|nr:DUF4493 domain-containing protein [Bacteroidales bacterium]MBQ1718107.1 DUF4493 domain-containing protein [Bacteroidales bacterium]MBQ2108188.1 DUF4493 domain-containing protein [Bacteroidales bacterium]MBQ2230060.1 DUF4493 domain-containing protein [Bacteroidales bacterium]MBQ3941524.1 DUF4493 domain-containing protein [Bacteroidales bacterium]